MKSRIYASAIAVILAGCGGGGSDRPGVNVVSGNPPAPAPATPPPPTAGPPTAGPPIPVNPPPPPPPVTVVVVNPPPPAEATLPPDAPPVNDPVEGPVAPPPDAPAPAPVPADQVVPTVPKAVLVNALRTSRYARTFSSDTPEDNQFSEAEIRFNGADFNHSSSFTPTITSFGPGKDPLDTHKTALVLNAAVGPDAFTFAGSGSVSYNGTPYNLQGPQWSVPDQVPLNTPKLVEWQVPGTPHWVRINAGYVTGYENERIRLCIDFLLPGVNRVSCTHHSGTDGSPIGADSIERLGGAEIVHETNDQSESPRRVLFCTFAEMGRLVPPFGKLIYSYSIFQFKAPYLYQDRKLTLELKAQPPRVTYTQTDLGGGLTEELSINPNGRNTINRRGNVVERWEQKFGNVDYGYTKTCIDQQPR